MKRTLNVLLLILTIFSFAGLVTLGFLVKDNIQLSIPMAFALILVGLFGSSLAYVNTL
jgi:hypothetical protein